MTPTPERERRPGGRGAAESRGERNQGQSTPPPDPDYDDEVPELEGYESDPLTADLWAAICMAADRGEFAEVAE